jgi:hypothetical protein
VEFANDGGQAVVLMKAGWVPSLTDADFTFQSKEFVEGDQVHMRSAISMQGP